VVKRKIPSPRRESNPKTPIVQPVSQRYTDCYYIDLLLYSDHNEEKLDKIFSCGLTLQSQINISRSQ